MQNNKILKRIRYALKFRDKKMQNIFSLDGTDISLDDINHFLVSEHDTNFKPCSNKILHSFLNGLILFYRGDSNNSSIHAFIRISKQNANNLVIKKLKIAFKLTKEDVFKIFRLGDLDISLSEVSGILRNEKSKMYRECGDKYIRKFLKGLAIHLRNPIPVG
ncbi:DUF1456 family protein [Fusobacterium sp. PH5-44]|uniref:DUF1456 family protein n=1 Tax=unclassified Fusobacterium TaxID=2648384 RepID=UPI003D24EA74